MQLWAAEQAGILMTPGSRLALKESPSNDFEDQECFLPESRTCRPDKVRTPLSQGHNGAFYRFPGVPTQLETHCSRTPALKNSPGGTISLVIGNEKPYVPWAHLLLRYLH